MPELHDALARYPTQQAAAQSWGLSPQFVCDMARGRRRVSYRVAVVIEAATGIPAMELIRPQIEKELDEARKSLPATTAKRIKESEPVPL